MVNGSSAQIQAKYQHVYFSCGLVSFNFRAKQCIALLGSDSMRLTLANEYNDLIWIDIDPDDMSRVVEFLQVKGIGFLKA